MTFPRRYARSCRRLRGSGSIPFRGTPAETKPRTKRELSSGAFAPMTPVVESSEDARHSRRHGCGGSAAAASHGFVARVGSARANGLDLWADRVSVAAFDFEPDACVPQLASSDDLADAVGDELARARCAAVRCAAD